MPEGIVADAVYAALTVLKRSSTELRGERNGKKKDSRALSLSLMRGHPQLEQAGVGSSESQQMVNINGFQLERLDQE